MNHHPTLRLTLTLLALLAFTATPALAKSSTTPTPKKSTPSKSSPKSSPRSHAKPHSAQAHSPQYQAAYADLRAAQLECDQAHRLFTGRLSTDPTYCKAKEIARKLSDDIESLRANGASLPQLTLAAETALEANSCASFIESQLALNFQPLVTARQRLQQAYQSLPRT